MASSRSLLECCAAFPTYASIGYSQPIVVIHFDKCQSKTLSFITGLTCFLLQDPSPAEHAATSLPVEGDETLASQTLGSEDQKLDGLGNNNVKVTSQYGVDATLSPLVLHAVKILLPAWHGNIVCGSKLMVRFAPDQPI